MAALGAAFGLCGRFLFYRFSRLADQAGFAGRIFFAAWDSRKTSGGHLFRLILEEVYKLITGSLALILLVGAMLGFLWSFLWFGALSNIGGVESIGIFLLNIHAIQIAPIMTTVIVIMRYGAPITWELAIMKSGGHFESLEKQGLSPELNLAAPRIIGALLAVPILLTVFTAASFAGAYYVAWKEEGQAVLEFVLTLSQQTKGAHFAIMAFKSLVIALTVSFFCVYNAVSIEPGDLNRGTQVMRQAMGEAFFFSVFGSVLVSVFYSV